MWQWPFHSGRRVRSRRCSANGQRSRGLSSKQRSPPAQPTRLSVLPQTTILCEGSLLPGPCQPRATRRQPSPACAPIRPHFHRLTVQARYLSAPKTARQACRTEGRTGSGRSSGIGPQNTFATFGQSRSAHGLRAATSGASASTSLSAAVHASSARSLQNRVNRPLAASGSLDHSLAASASTPSCS